MRTRRKIVSWVLLGIIFFQSFGTAVLYTLYFADKSVFIELFCINQDKPEMHCDGSCMLAQMTKQKEQDKNKAPILLKLQILPLFFSETLSAHLNFFFAPKNEGVFYQFQNNYSFDFLKNIFRPPILA